MIPSDLASRLRMLAEANFFDSEPPVQGTARVREIQARLPQLMPGQQFTAHITRGLPDNTFQAVVAGKEYTLALNHPAKAGDVLELVVTRQAPNAVFARLAGDAAASAAAETSRPNLSPTGRLISFLLTGQPAPQPAALAAGKPLLNAPPADNGAALAPALRQALSQSGLFYEAHQARWLSGKLGTDALQREPQGQQAPSARTPAGSPSETSTAPRVAANPMPGNAAATGMRGVDGIAERTAADTGAANAVRGPVVAERLIPIVHQQLDAMGTQQYVLHGQAWPGQHFEWDIEDPRREGQDGGDEAEEGWESTLRLQMPRLGDIEARLFLTPAGVAIRLITSDEGVAAALTDARDRLDSALAAADIPMTGFVSEARDGG